MTGNKASDTASPDKARRSKDGPQTALDRRKAALKANMARRKEQARARAATSGPEDSETDATGA